MANPQNLKISLWNMFKLVLDFPPTIRISPPSIKIQENIPSQASLAPVPVNKLSKQSIRNSLKASTLDSIFSSIFGCVTGGVLLTNFLLNLGASNVEIGLLSALPMVMNFLQPVGAYIADKQTSRKSYNLLIFGLSRLLWLLLVGGIAFASWFHTNSHQLIFWTVGIVFAANLLSALGSPSWLSWMMVIVPDRLRGRYFGFRNSAASLTSLLCVPLMGLAVSIAGTDLNGYAMILFVGIVAGILALGCQSLQVDVNPQIVENHSPENDAPPEPKNFMSVFQDANFLKFLVYFGFWTFSVNLSSPFFNIYLLKNLDVNISLVTVYNSLSAAANLVALIVWGKLADRIGNRPLLLLVGILVAITPLFWLSTGNYPISWWLLLPLIHIFTGSTWAAIDLCNNNIQMEIAAKQQPSTYFGVAAAVAGLTGALGTTAGGFLAEFPLTGGIGGLFALSSVMRLLALLPLVFVQEPRGSSISDVLDFLRPSKTENPEILTTELKE